MTVSQDISVNAANLMISVLASPDDDEPRLTYADWLTEHGDPRGEFVRLQCRCAKGDATAETRNRIEELLSLHSDDWLGEVSLRCGEGRFVRGFVEQVRLEASRAVEVVDHLVELPLRDIELLVDVGGNHEEVAHVAEKLAVRLPSSFGCMRIDRSHHWDDNAYSDELRVTTTGGPYVDVVFGESTGPRPAARVLTAALDLCSTAAALDIGFAARGPVEIDDVIQALCVTGPLPAMHEFRFSFRESTGRDWMRWLKSRRIADLLRVLPNLSSLSVPMAELHLDAVVHKHLRDLELHWLGMTPMGPADPWNYGRPDRASGLQFLRVSRLPSLERLAVDLQFDWYVPWQSDDISAICEATLPRLRRSPLSSRSSSSPDVVLPTLASPGCCAVAKPFRNCSA